MAERSTIWVLKHPRLTSILLGLGVLLVVLFYANFTAEVWPDLRAGRRTPDVENWRSFTVGLAAVGTGLLLITRTRGYR